jgi:lipopolysaccharide transport system permease protein
MQMARRDMIERYRGSMFGFMWSLFNPLVMLAVYTFVFSVVFQLRWPGSTGSKAEYATYAFAGMIVFQIFSESASRAPTLVLGNANLVKKVVFPLEVLPWVVLASSLFHAFVSYLVLLGFVAVIFGKVHLTAILFPLVIVPVVLFSLGVAWFLASIGVFFRDTNHTVTLVVAILMFFSPIFYPLSAIPKDLLWLFSFNPMVQPIMDARLVAITGQLPDLVPFGLQLGASAVVAYLGLWWFMRSKHAFADVL